MLPTAHGFDEFFGNPYHVEELENVDYPKNPELKKKFGPRQKPGSFNLDRVMESVTGPRPIASDTPAPFPLSQRQVTSVVGAAYRAAAQRCVLAP